MAISKGFKVTGPQPEGFAVAEFRPWTGGRGIVDANGKSVMQVRYRTDRDCNELARRVVAALDYCHGITTEQLEARNNGRWVMTTVVISTAHIPQEVNDRLSGITDQLVIAMPDGWLVYVGEAYPNDDLPQPLQTCIEWAKTQGFEWLRLDQAGDEIDALPKYDW